MEKIKAALSKCGFTVPTPYQHQVFPAILSGRDVAAETQKAKGKTTAFLLPLFIKQPAKKLLPFAIILTDTLSSVRRIESNYIQFAEANNSMITIAPLGYENNAGNDLSLLRRNPAIIVGTPDRIIDHIRRNNLTLTHVKKMIIYLSESNYQTGFEQDVLFIASKLKKRTQFQLFMMNLNSLGTLIQLLNHPQYLLYRTGKLLISCLKENHQWTRII